MYCRSVDVLLWEGCYVLSWFGSAVVGRLLCTVPVWSFICGDPAIYCPGVEVLLLGFCYILSLC